MAKTATLKKLDVRQARKAGKSSLKNKTAKKPILKVVKNSAKTIMKAVAKGKKPAKPVAAKKAPVTKKMAAPVKKKAVAKQQVAAKTPALVAKKPVAVTAKAAPAAKTAAKKEASKQDFGVGDHVVYPTHGVGRIVSEETHMVGDISLRMLVIAFDKDRMTLRVPINRAAAAGLRHVSGNDQMAKVFLTLKSRARASRGMWSRRAQEYETKINSGNIFSIAEVVRDLHPNVDQAERSYSERMIYESALGRLVGELAATEGTDQKIATDKLLKLLRSKVAA